MGCADGVAAAANISTYTHLGPCRADPCRAAAAAAALCDEVARASAIYETRDRSLRGAGQAGVAIETWNGRGGRRLRARRGVSRRPAGPCSCVMLPFLQRQARRIPGLLSLDFDQISHTEANLSF